ncbi:hypothetical protein ACFLU6_04135 [Acidobacteriota bacterium]
MQDNLPHEKEVNTMIKEQRTWVPRCFRWFLGCLSLALVLMQVTTSSAAVVSGRFDEAFGVWDSINNVPTPPITDSQTPQRYWMVFDPFNPEVLYTASWGSGIWKSTDRGRTWLPKSKGLVNLMVDLVRPDPYNEGVIYAGQTPNAGNGAGYLYRSDDSGESWHRVAFTNQPLPPNMFFTDIEFAVDGGLHSVFVTFMYSESDCGFIFRSNDGGETWCSYLGLCGTEVLPDPKCPSGVWADNCPPRWPQITGNDGSGVDAIVDDSLGIHELYVHDSKTWWPCRASYRSDSLEPGLVEWQHRDKWDDFTVKDAYDAWWLDHLYGESCACIDYRPSGERLRALDIASDPDNPDIRFARHFRQRDPCCNTNPSPMFCGNVTCDEVDRGGFDCCTSAYAELLDLALVGNDGERDLANPDPERQNDRVWRNVIDIKKCIGPADVTPIRFTPTLPRRVFAQTGDFILMCDPMGSWDNCFEPDGWSTIWNFSPSSLTVPPDCWSGLSIGPGRDWRSEGIAWRRMIIDPEPGPAGTNQLLFVTSRRHARLEYLRLWNDGAVWHEEQLQDPVTCENSGIGLVSPLQVIEINTGRLISSSPRDLFVSDDGGATWLSSTAVGSTLGGYWWKQGAMLAQSPANPEIFYAANHWGIARTEDGGQTFHLVEKLLYKIGCNAPYNKPACFPAVTDGPCNRDKPCGRVDQSSGMVGSITQLIVDVGESDRLYAATENGLWTWKYPFDGWSYPHITPDCLSVAGQACAGEAWEPFCPPGNPMICNLYFHSIAQDPDPIFHQHLYAGADGQFYRSMDGGANWMMVLSGPTVKKILILPSGGPGSPRFILGTDQGIWVSETGFSFMPTLIDVDVSDVDANESGPPYTVYAAATDFSEVTDTDGLYVSPDSGLTWSKILAEDHNQEFLSVFVDSDGEVYAGKVGDGLYRLDSGPLLECERNAKLPVAGDVGYSFFGNAVAGLGDVPDPPTPMGAPECAADWVSIQVRDADGELHARILDGESLDVRPAISTGLFHSGLGTGLTSVGDIDGNNCPDFAVGQPETPAAFGTVKTFDSCTGSMIYETTESVYMYGVALASGGDYLAVGAPADLGIDARVFIYDRTSGGLVTTLIPPPDLGRFGRALAFGDFDGDDTLDLAVGAPVSSPEPGYVVIYSTASWNPIGDTLVGPFPGAEFGYSLASGYDLRGAGGPDGADDLVVGAPARGTWFGSAHWHANLSDAPIVAFGESPTDNFGQSVLLSGDATGDERPDMLVGAPAYKSGVTPVGAVYVFEEGFMPLAFSCRMTGFVTGGSFGAALAEAGDVNNNTTADFLIGSPGGFQGWSILMSVQPY